MPARVIAIVNQKGGVGKTTTAVNLGAALAAEDFRVLLADLDAQGNATTGLGFDRTKLTCCIYNVLTQGLPLREVLLETGFGPLTLAPARMDLAAAEIELAPVIAREVRLRQALNDVLDSFDYILLDAPPSLGILTINCLAAAHEVLIPIQCEYYALEGLSQLLTIINMVREGLNPALRILGVLLTMYDRRTTLSREVAREVRQHFDGRVFSTIIPRSVRLSEAPSHGLPCTTYAPLSPGARSYRLLAKEVIAVGNEE